MATTLKITTPTTVSITIVHPITLSITTFCIKILDNDICITEVSITTLIILTLNIMTLHSKS